MTQEMTPEQMVELRKFRLEELRSRFIEAAIGGLCTALPTVIGQCRSIAADAVDIADETLAIMAQKQREGEA